MAGEEIDALVLAARFDPTGLDAIPAAVQRAVRDAQKGVPELEIISADKLRAQLQASGADVKGFFAGARADMASANAEALRVLDAMERAFVGGATGGAGGGPRVIRDKVADLKILAGQLQQIPTVADAANASLARLNAAFDASGAAGRRASEGGAAWARGVDNLRVQNARAAGSFDSHTKSVNLARNSLVVLASQALGTSSTLGQLAQSALLFAGGATAVIATAGGVLLLAKAYDVLTSSERKAREEREKLIAAQRSRLENQGNPIQATLTADRERQAELAREIAGWEKAILQDSLRGLPVQLEVLKLRKLIAEQRRIELAIQADQAALDAQHRADITAVLNRAQEQRVTSITEAPALGTADASTFREIRAEMARQLQIINAEGVALVDRNAAQATYNRLVEALHVPLREAEAAQRAQTEFLEINVQRAAEFLQVLQRINAEEAARLATAKAAQTQRLGLDPGQQTSRIDFGFDAVPTDLIERAVDKLSDNIAKANATWRRFRNEVEDTRTPAERVVDSLLQVGDAAFGIADAAHSIGLIDDEAANAIASVGDLANAMAQLASGNIIGGILGGIGALGGMFGESAIERERNETLKENNLRLAELRQSLDAADIGAQRFGAARSQLAEARAAGLDRDPRIAGAPKGTNERLMDDQVEALGIMLRKSGETVEEWAARIERLTGIDVLDEQGHLIAGSLAQATEAINAMSAAALAFSATASGIEARTTTEEKLGILERSSDPRVAALEHDRDVQLEALNLGEAEEARIRALDLKTAEGRAAFLEQQRELFKRAKAGELTPEELGAIENVDELGAIIGDTADDINAFDEAARGATDALKGLTNIPDTFKLASAEFAARAVDGPLSAPVSRFTGPQMNGTTGPVFQGDISINVVALPGQSPGDIARRVRVEFEQMDSASFGMERAP